MTAGAFSERRADAPFVIGSYFERRRVGNVVDRDGVAIDFAAEHRPLEAYATALERCGLAIDALRELVFPRELWRDEHSARWARIPSFLHVRAVRR